MAIYVLTEGLKNNPGYVTARSILGKLLLEKGELEASQKEFEEVVKAIPDNLVAQRKLGELYAFQNRPDEAVKHLKIVFSANPRDAELASLVSDLEAGRDVRQRIHLPKPQLSPGKSAGKGVQAAPSPQAAARPIPARPAVAPAAPVAPKTAAVKETQAPKGLAAQTGQKAAGRTAPPVAVTQAAPKAEQAEEPEDIMTIEPLEPVTEIPEAAISEIVAPETAAPEMAAPAPDFLAEEDYAASVAPLEEPFAEMAPSPVEQASEASPEAESFFAEASPVLELEEKEPFPGPAEVVAESDIIGAEVVEDALEAVAAAEAPAESAEKSDDFTTDTLAELYISQGFYEKAIDIYERMLADKPTSVGLKNKLAKVREMAAESGPAAAPAAFAEAATEPAEAGL
ncbi:MAG TPA: tetratricopeptide repeat protein, partial [Nitrospirota bacterium]